MISTGITKISLYSLTTTQTEENEVINQSSRCWYFAHLQDFAEDKESTELLSIWTLVLKNLPDPLKVKNLKEKQKQIPFKG